VAALIKMQLVATDSETQTYEVKLWHSRNKILIAHAELLKQRGQYYKANLVIQQLKDSLKERVCHDAESTRVQEAFVCLWASTLCIMGKYGQAVSLHQEVLDQRRYRYGAKHPKVATSLCALGTLKVLRCEYAEGSEMLEESLAMRRELYPADHPAIAASLYARGVAFAKLGRFPEAAADVTHSLEMRRMKLGTHHPSVAQSATALADIQTQMGDPLRAWKNHSFALGVFRDRYGVDKHRDVAQCLFNMACSAAARGAYLEAVVYHEQALQLREAVLELFRSEGTVEIHLGVELSKVHLASVYALVGRLEEAKGFMKGAVKNVTKILGNRNVLVAESLCHLGELCRTRGNYADAKQLFALAFNVVQELFGDDHPLIATIMLLSSENLRIPGMHAEAIELETSAYDVRSYLFGSDNIHTAMAVYQRAQLLRDSGKQSDAEKQYIRALHVLLAKVGENNGLYGKVLGDFAECLRLGGKLEISEKYFNRAIESQHASYGEGSLQVAETLCNFTLLLMDLHHPAEAAEVLQERVVPTFVRLVGAAHPATLYAKANLALARQFARFFEHQGTEEGSLVLEGVLTHPDIVGLVDALRGSSFAADHPWLLRFAEGSQSLTLSGGSLGSPQPGAAASAGDEGSVHSSVSYPASLAPSNTQGAESAGPASLESQNNAGSAFTPRGPSLSSRLGLSLPSQNQSNGQLDAFSPSDSDSQSYNSYGNQTSYTPSDATESLAGSMSYSVSHGSDISRMSYAHTPHSYSHSQTHSQSQSQGYSQNYSQGYSQSYTQGQQSGVSQPTRSEGPDGSLSEYPEGSLETGGSYPSGSQVSASYTRDNYPSGSYPSGTYPGSSYPGSSNHPSSGRYQSGSHYVSQHSAVLEYGEEYSVGSASQSQSASASVSMSLTPRSYRGRRNFSLTPSGTSVMSRPLTNVEESSLGSWDHLGDEELSLDEYLSRSATLEGDESVGSIHTMDSLYHD
jgi:tetratricopeptide (TPR) repeat protein